MSGRVSVPCWYATPVANAPWKPLIIDEGETRYQCHEIGWKSDWLGSHCWSRIRMSFNIRERDTSYCWIRSPYRRETRETRLNQQIPKDTYTYTIGLKPAIQIASVIIHRIYGLVCCSNAKRFVHTKYVLKLYCRYLYTRPCMTNHIWGLKQLWLQVNGHAWFHLQRLCWPVRNGEGAKNSKWKYMSPAGFEPTPRQSTTGKLQRLRPLGHAG